MARRCCCCGVRNLSGTSNWTINSGTLATTLGDLDFAGEFVPNATLNWEAFDLTFYGIDGTFSFSIDSKTYSVDTTGTESGTGNQQVSVTCDGTTRTMTRSYIGNDTHALLMQLRITPTHAYLMVAESNTSPSINSNKLDITGGVFVMATADLAATPSGSITMTATGTVAEAYLSSAEVKFEGGYGDPATRDCRGSITLGCPYYAYLALSPAFGYDPSLVQPDVTFSARPLWGTHFETPPITGNAIDGGSYGIYNGVSVYDVPTDTWNAYADFFACGFNGPLAVNLQSDMGSNSMTVVGCNAGGSFAIQWPEPTAVSPYPKPNYRASFIAEGDAYQPGPTDSLNWLYWWQSPDPDGDTPSATVVDVPINDLTTVPYSLEYDCVTYKSTQHPTFTPASFTVSFDRFEQAAVATWSF